MTKYHDVNPQIITYVHQNILPIYDSFDNAHNREHVDRVIKNSLSIAKDYCVDIDKVYVTAAYHDVGLSQGREDHERHSAIYLLADFKLNKWFSVDDMVLISEAIEDHRASNIQEPRNIYGKIVSDADRDLDYTMVLNRVIRYSLEYFPSYTPEEHFNRTYLHIQDKCGENGYLKIWLDTEPNRSNLMKIRNALSDPDRFKADFMRIFKSGEVY